MFLINFQKLFYSEDQDAGPIEIEETIEVHQTEDYGNDSEQEIKLRKPKPGSKIANLTNIIETQVTHRYCIQYIYTN